MSFLNQIRKLDWIIIVIVLLLVSVGLLSIYSISQNQANNSHIFKRQLIYVGLGILLMFIFTFFDYRIFRDNSFILLGFYLFALLLLLGVLLVGREVRGVSSWFRVGQIGFEPVELMKLVIILILAKYFSLRHIEVHRIHHLIVSGLYVIFPLVLLLLQPELGYVLIIAMIWLAIILVAGIKLKHLLILFLITAILFSISWFFVLKNYQKDRITSFLNPQSDPLGKGYQIIQSVITIGSGKIFGQGLGHGTQSQLKFLPEQHTDFIFATIAEEWGFLGSAFVLVLFFLLFYRLVKVSLRSTNNFACLVSLGVGVMILVQAIINIGMNMGLFPIIGIPLPFISFGGSCMVMSFVALGIVQSIVVRGK